MDAAEWMVLDNLKNGWEYTTNLIMKVADQAYDRCESRGWILGGKITASGEIALMTNRKWSSNERKQETLP